MLFAGVVGRLHLCFYYPLSKSCDFDKDQSLVELLLHTEHRFSSAVSSLAESIRQLSMFTHPDLCVVSGIVHLHRFTLIAQVDRTFVADVVDLAAVPHNFHIVQISNHVQCAFVRFHQYPILVPDDLQVVFIGIDPDTFPVTEKVLRFTNGNDHFLTRPTW